MLLEREIGLDRTEREVENAVDEVLVEWEDDEDEELDDDWGSRRRQTAATA